VQYKRGYRHREKREQEEAAQAAAGLVSERYAGISSIEFHMTYYHRALNPVLMERTLRFLPENYARFHVRCEQDGCTGGGYDLAPMVAGMVKSRKKSAKGTLFCHGSNGTVGHASIAYEVSIQYHRLNK
jgi:hypothetical protein